MHIIFEDMKKDALEQQDSIFCFFISNNKIVNLTVNCPYMCTMKGEHVSLELKPLIESEQWRNGTTTHNHDSMFYHLCYS